MIIRRIELTRGQVFTEEMLARSGGVDAEVVSAVEAKP